MSKANPFPVLMRAFFYEWLVEQRNIHPYGRSYHDLAAVLAVRRGWKKVAMITMTDLAASEVSAFLGYAEHERGGTIAQRATAGLPQSAASSALVATRILHRSRNASKSSTCPSSARRYRTAIWIRTEVTAILAQPDRSTLEGMRDRPLLLSFTSNGGARIQEALDLCCPETVEFLAPKVTACADGKGRKERICRSGLKQPCCWLLKAATTGA